MAAEVATAEALEMNVAVESVMAVAVAVVVVAMCRARHSSDPA